MSFLVLDSAAATTIVLWVGDNQVVGPGDQVPINPTVRLTDTNGNPVQDVSVTFAVASGGGSLLGSAVQSTDSGGFASIGWALGASPGSNTLTATVAGLNGSPVTFHASDVLSSGGWTSPSAFAAVCTVG